MNRCVCVSIRWFCLCIQIYPTLSHVFFSFSWNNFVICRLICDKPRDDRWVESSSFVCCARSSSIRFFLFFYIVFCCIALCSWRCHKTLEVLHHFSARLTWDILVTIAYDQHHHHQFVQFTCEVDRVATIILIFGLRRRRVKCHLDKSRIICFIIAGLDNGSSFRCTSIPVDGVEFNVAPRKSARVGRPLFCFHISISHLMTFKWTRCGDGAKKKDSEKCARTRRKSTHTQLAYRVRAVKWVDAFGESVIS